MLEWSNCIVQNQVLTFEAFIYPASSSNVMNVKTIELVLFPIICHLQFALFGYGFGKCGEKMTDLISLANIFAPSP